MDASSHGPSETMSVRGIGMRGWLLVAATTIALGVYLAMALAGLLFQPPWDSVAVGLGLALPILTLFTAWYFFDVVWRREIRRRRRAESAEIPGMATAEALLRLMDYADRILDRLTRYTGWFFFLVLLALFFVPFFYSLGFFAFGAGNVTFTLFVGGGNLAFWVAYFYYYYKIKHESDLWKERIAWLREREQSLLER